jgi:hypothetical protein
MVRPKFGETVRENLRKSNKSQAEPGYGRNFPNFRVKKFSSVIFCPPLTPLSEGKPAFFEGEKNFISANKKILTKGFSGKTEKGTVRQGLASLEK